MNNIWRSRGKFWAGAGCASLWSWLAFALAKALLMPLHRNFDWGALVAIPLALCGLLAIFFGAGVLASYFWIGVADAGRNTRWGEWTVLLILAPLLWLGWWTIPLLVFAFLLAILPFDFGRDWGEEIWEGRRWRHLFGAANDWERDADEIKSP